MQSIFNWLCPPLLPAPSDEIDDDVAQTWETRERLFSERQNHLWGLRQSSFEKSDELIVAVSSAFLALSVGFIKEIVPLARSVGMPLLVASWICFFGAIIANFISHFASRRAMDVEEEHARHYLLEGRKKYLENGINRATGVTESLNSGAAILFGVGVLLTLVFVSSNVLREQRYQAHESAKAKSKTARQSSTGARSHTTPHPTNSAPTKTN